MVHSRQFFYLHFANEERLALAIAPDNPEIDERLSNPGPITDWHRLTFVLDDGIATDYLANTSAYRLCSDRLMDAIESSRSGNEQLQWLPVVVLNRAKRREHEYWVLHSMQSPDVINRADSVLTAPTIVRAVIDRDLAAAYRVLTFPHDPLRLIVDNTVRDRIERAECTGLSFSKVPVA